MCSDSEKNMSAFADQNHAPSLMCVRLERVNEQLQQFSLGERLSATEAKLLEFLLGSR